MHPLAAVVVAGWVLGAVDGALAGAPKSRGAVILFSAVLGSVATFLIALPVWLGATLASRVGPVRRLIDKLRAKLSPSSDHEAQLRLYAFGLAALAVAAFVSLAAAFVFPKLFDLQELDLAKQLAVVAVAVLVASSLVGALIVARGARAAVTALDRRGVLRVPWPHALAFLLFVTIPVFSTVYPFLRRYAGMLGVARDAGFGGLVSIAALQLYLALRSVPARLATRGAAAIAVVGLGAAIGVGALAKKNATTFAAAEGSAVASLGARAARWLTDFDRDGASSLFGGRDCAPFDGKRAPTRPEIPGNGLDEDCNGSDSVGRGQLGDLVRFSDALKGKQVRPYNVVWILMETVRADHVSALGYGKPTMPYLDKLAKESLVFTRAYSQSSATVLSVPSMLSGIDTGMATWSKAAGHPQMDSGPMLAERLKGKGYKTGFVIDTYLKRNFLSIQRGFDDVILAEPDNKPKNNRPRRNLISNAKASDFLAKVKPGEEFFLLVYYPDQHSPYTRHKDVDASKFEKGEVGDYDTELAFADQQIRALVETLKARPSLWENTVLVVTADHGEEFGEHGGDRHAVTCYDEVVHVPLFVRVPGVPGQRVEQRVALVDIVPTILELVGLRDGTDNLSGQSLLVPTLRSDKIDPARPIFCNIASITSKLGTFFRRSVRTDKYTLIHDFNEGKFSLFDAEKDRGEQQDVSGAGEHGAAFANLKAVLEASLTGNLRDHTKMSGQAAPVEAMDDAPDDP